MGLTAFIIEIYLYKRRHFSNDASHDRFARCEAIRCAVLCWMANIPKGMEGEKSPKKGGHARLAGLLAGSDQAEFLERVDPAAVAAAHHVGLERDAAAGARDRARRVGLSQEGSYRRHGFAHLSRRSCITKISKISRSSHRVRPRRLRRRAYPHPRHRRRPRPTLPIEQGSASCRACGPRGWRGTSGKCR